MIKKNHHVLHNFTTTSSSHITSKYRKNTAGFFSAVRGSEVFSEPLRCNFFVESQSCCCYDPLSNQNPEFNNGKIRLHGKLT